MRIHEEVLTDDGLTSVTLRCPLIYSIDAACCCTNSYKCKFHRFPYNNCFISINEYWSRCWKTAMSGGATRCYINRMNNGAEVCELSCNTVIVNWLVAHCISLSLVGSKIRRGGEGGTGPKRIAKTLSTEQWCQPDDSPERTFTPRLENRFICLYIAPG